MENIFEIAKNLNFVVPSNVKVNPNSYFSYNQVGIFIHLHYEETLDYYFNYIKRIPNDIKVYITYSSENLDKMIKKFIKKYNLCNCILIKKKNRGRDISSLLVACRQIVLKYKYICFIHDKKAQDCEEHKDDPLYKSEVKMWIDNLWSNTILSGNYIYNVINILAQNESLGLLVPPEMAGYRLAHAYLDTWGTNFKKTAEMAKNWGLDINLNREYPPISLGTVFWGKSKSLKKILELNWTYEDFQEEPLPDDGTISHAIERILGYIVQDAGFNTGYIMSDRYAEIYVMQLKDILRKTYQNLQSLGIYSIGELERYVVKEKILSFMKKYKIIYFYGAGKIGKEMYQLFWPDKCPKAFVVSEKVHENDIYMGIPVYSIDEINVNESTGFVITAGKKLQKQIINELENRGIKNYITCNSK